MKYNFDKPINRCGTNSYKWDSADADIIPLWVADMDFSTAPEITEALQRRAAHGIFGYVRVPDSYYNALISWFKRRHNWSINRESIIYTTGVVPAISAIIEAITVPGDKVLIQTPVYNCFFSSIRNYKCSAVENELVYDDSTYSIDFEDFEAKASDPSVKAFLLCNPHNPAGRVWTRNELKRMGDICLKHNVFVIADEIHCELTLPGFSYTPFASLDHNYANNCAVCTSPSKAFNIAGLQIANIIISNPDIYKAVNHAINVNEVCDVNPFGVDAMIAAYNYGEPWIDELNCYISANYIFLTLFIAKNIPQLKVCALEGTYLAWIDISATGMDCNYLADRLKTEARVWLNAGTMYGRNGKDFLRINLACPQSTLAEGLKRINNWLNINGKL